MKIMEIGEFVLESVEKTFEGRIVGRVTGAAHALLNSDRGAKSSRFADDAIVANQIIVAAVSSGLYKKKT